MKFTDIIVTLAIAFGVSDSVSALRCADPGGNTCTSDTRCVDVPFVPTEPQCQQCQPQGSESSRSLQLHVCTDS
ncbi:hypothetical protein E2P81_ATG05881 [Venturia nashicola]|uniref:Uncharacterized protein n=1 Tax=Venturia nashicola TaxID=86259 RepID=A0A4Z1P3Z0_9PEZI|nr:hypothetical protein E6O75_ATG06026 [Venturia nashicola]TLD29587.1 hypothetical protein E2P81_ATG05881 [Venturia nashicola]